MRIVGSVVLLSLALYSCTGGIDQSLTMPVRSLEIAESVRANEPLVVRLEAASMNSCQRFERFEPRRVAERLELVIVGREQQSPGTACLQAVSYLPLEYTDPPMPTRSSPFEVVVNGELRRSVVVAP